MSNENSVIKLIKVADNPVRISVFNDSFENVTPEALVEMWLKHIELTLGQCVFRNNFCALTMTTAREIFQPTAVTSTEEVVLVLHECFNQPQTIRLDITTPHKTTFSWIFAVASDLNK